MPMCVGINGQPCPGEKNGILPVVIAGKTMLLCRVCNGAAGPLARSEYVDTTLNSSLSLTPGRLTLELDASCVSSPSLIGSQAYSQPVFDTTEDMDTSEQTTVTKEVAPAAESRQSNPGEGANNAQTEKEISDNREPQQTLVCNELLCYCFNMINNMAQTILQKICAEYYTETAIDKAKELILESNENEAQRTKLLKKRRGTDKKSTTMKDILDTIRANDPDVFPVYVAKSLGNMPPLTKNCVNMASMMVDLAQLRTDVDTFQGMANSIADLTESVSAVKKQLDAMSEVQKETGDPRIPPTVQQRLPTEGVPESSQYSSVSSVPSWSRSAPQQRDSLSPTGLFEPEPTPTQQHSSVTSGTSHREPSKLPGLSEPSSRPDSVSDESSTGGLTTTAHESLSHIGLSTETRGLVSPDGLSCTANQRRPTSHHDRGSNARVSETRPFPFREVPPVTRLLDDHKAASSDQNFSHKMNFAAKAANRGEASGPDTGNDNFVTVGRNGRPLRPGKPRSAAVTADINLRPQRPRKSEIVYISNVNPDLNSDDLKTEIKRRFGIQVRCKRLNPDMVDPDFASYQVFVQPDQATVILDKNSWPSWIVVRPWEKRGRKSGEPGRRVNVSRDAGVHRIQTVIGVHRKPSPRVLNTSAHDFAHDSYESRYCTPTNWYDTPDPYHN